MQMKTSKQSFSRLLQLRTNKLTAHKYGKCVKKEYTINNRGNNKQVKKRHIKFVVINTIVEKLRP